MNLRRFLRERFARIATTNSLSQSVRRTKRIEKLRLENLEQRALLSGVPPGTGADLGAASSDTVTELATSAEAPSSLRHVAENVGYLAMDAGSVHGKVANVPNTELPNNELPDNVVLHTPGELMFYGENDEFLQIEHNRDLELENGTVAFSFTAADVSGWNGLFSKDASGQEQGGHFTAWIVNGGLKVRLQQLESGKEYLYAPEGSIQANQEHHVAITFGSEGLRLHVDGVLVDAEGDYTQGIADNTQPIVIGASIASRTPAKPNSAREEFEGVINDFTLYDYQLTRTELKVLAGVDDEELAAPEVTNGVLTGSVNNDELDASLAGVNRVFGDYGNDVLTANTTAGTIVGESPSEEISLDDFANLLDGGHGNDILQGSEHNDLLVSLADGREPLIAQPWDATDDPYGEINVESNTYYPGQPIEGDDILIGGGGADLFYFQTQINAKERILLEHVKSDGTINFSGGGVAGENDNVHDHWVDGIGDELIADFSREEGDHIFIEGHTTEAYSIEYLDTDGDHNYDTTRLNIWSNQANGGAHDEDRLGSITVPNVLLNASDYSFNKTNHGIIKHISELDYALAPHENSVPDDGVGPIIGPVNDGEQLDDVVLHTPGELMFNGGNDEFLQIEHNRDLELENGTVAFSFTAADVSGWNGLFSKDASGQEQGGHLTAWVVNGGLKVRMQQLESGKEYLYAPEGSIQANQEHHVAITFGSKGLRLHVDGVLVDAEGDYTQGIADNTQPIVIGASIASRTPAKPNSAREEFEGLINDFTLYETQLSLQQIEELANADLAQIDRIFEKIG